MPTVANCYFALYDVAYIDSVPSGPSLGQFQSASGGQMTVDMVSYTQCFLQGGSAEKFIPGQTSFTPMVLGRDFDSECEALYKWFMDSSNGDVKAAKINCSVVLTTETGAPQVVWNLFNTIPTKLSEFSFSQKERVGIMYFTITLQPEWMEIVFL
ncbi:MAG: phage tail protein [Anaerolineaceae bacterium]|nr:phage tail protein [Anaerolineaceae bacterium]